MTPHPENPRRGVITAEKIDLDFHDILKHSDSRKARMNNAVEELPMRQEAERVARDRIQKSHTQETVRGAKKSGGKNSDSKEYFGVGCPCGWQFRKQDDQKGCDFALRLHSKVCKVAKSIDATRTPVVHHVITGRTGVESVSTLFGF